jgi:hypothetical protein
MKKLFETVKLMPRTLKYHERISSVNEQKVWFRYRSCLSADVGNRFILYPPLSSCKIDNKGLVGRVSATEKNKLLAVNLSPCFLFRNSLW